MITSSSITVSSSHHYRTTLLVAQQHDSCYDIAASIVPDNITILYYCICSGSECNYNHCCY